MGKRFTDTTIWVDKPWFIDLSPTEKCAFMFIKDRCDAVGVWVPNFKMADVCIGDKVDWNVLVTKVNGNIQILANGKWWISDMCAFQYGELSEETKDRARLSHIRLLKKHGLWEQILAPSKGHTRGLHSPKEKDKEKAKVKEKEKVKDKDKDKSLTKPGPDLPLYTLIKESFEAKHGVFDDYGKEGKMIHQLIRKAKARSPDNHTEFTKLMVVTFWRLKGEGDRFWKDQPFLPSALNSLWARVMEHARGEVVDEEFEEITRGTFCK